jgi:hypothetical protein
MNPDEAAIVTEIASAIKALNNALEKAYTAKLQVKIDYQNAQEIGRYGERTMVRAEISKQAFVQRVG